MKNTNSRATRVLHIGSKCLSLISQLFCHTPLPALMSFPLTMTGSQILAHIYTVTCRNLKLCFLMELNPTCSFHPETDKHRASCALQWLNPSLASSHSTGPQHIPPMPFQERAGTRPGVYQTQGLVGQVSHPSLRTPGALQHYLQLQHHCTRVKIITWL